MINSVKWMLSALTFVTIALSVVACGSTTAPLQPGAPPQVSPGTSKADVLEMLGEPDERKIMVKQQEYIWGPAEEWWHTLEMGDNVEIWSYLFPKGRLQLYFLRGSDTVEYEAFIDKDIVY
jgi:hypothetical protein